MFLNAKVVRFFYSPSAFPSQNTFCICVFLPAFVSLSLLFHPTLLDFLSPTGSPDDTTASTVPFFPPFSIFARKNFSAQSLLKGGFKTSGFTFLVFYVIMCKEGIARCEDW